MYFKIIFAFFFLLFINSNLISQTIQKKSSSSCDFNCFPSKWLVSAHVSPLLSSLTSEKFNSEETQKLGMSAGFNLAYYFVNNGKLRMALALGTDYNMIAVDRNLNFNDSVWTVDFLNDKVYLFEKGNIAETQKIGFVNIPLQLKFNYQISPRVDLYFNASYFYSISIVKTFASDGVITRKGYYPTINCWVYDDDVDGSNFFYPTNKVIAGSGDLKTNNGSGLAFSLGIQYKITPKLAFFAGAKFISGLNSISNYSNTPQSTYANDYHSLNTLMRRGENIKATALGLEFGFSFGLGTCKHTTKETPSDFKIDSLKPFVNQIKKDSVKLDSLKIVDNKFKMDSLKIDTLAILHNTSINNKDTNLTSKIDDKKIANDSLTLIRSKIIQSSFLTIKEVNQMLAKGTKFTEKKTVIQTVEFETNTYNLTSETRKNIDQLYELMAKETNCFVSIYGNTDNVGNDAYNKDLSQKRSDAIVKYLVSRGILASRLKAIGVGASKPIDTNNTPEGRHNNRRAEFELNWK